MCWHLKLELANSLTIALDIRVKAACVPDAMIQGQSLCLTNRVVEIFSAVYS